MKSIELQEALFQGAVSLEPVDGGLKPWRIPYRQYDLFPPNGLNHTGQCSAGVRLRFASSTTTIQLEVAPVEVLVQYDLVLGDELLVTRELAAGETVVVFDGLPATDKTIEIYLPQKAPTIVKVVRIDEDADWRIPEDRRVKWLAYGSSITQCNGAYSPAQTWPALVARRFGLHLTSLGYAGNCHLEPMVARVIREQPADVISLCLGINVYGGTTLSPRTFRAAVIGFVQIVREKHPETPIVMMSPIWSPPREDKQNAVGFTLSQMRLEVEEAYKAMTALGDANLHYVDGMTIFNEQYAEHLPDELHPNGPGYAIMGQNYGDKVMEPLLERYGLAVGEAAGGR